MPPDVHRLLEREAQRVNSTILMNRRAYADLTSNLLSGELKKRATYTVVCHWSLLGGGGATENTIQGSLSGAVGLNSNRRCHVPSYRGGVGGLKWKPLGQDRGGGLSEETIAFIHFGGPFSHKK